MRLTVFAKPRAKEEGVVKIDDTHFEVAVKEQPLQGRANTAIIKVLAAYLGVRASQMHIVLGKTGKYKVIEVDE